MKKLKSKEVKIAIATILSGVLLYFGINYLKGINIMKPANYYYVTFSDVTGMSVSTPVFLDGYKVGLVNDMQYDYNKLGNITIELSLDNRLKLPAGTSAYMETSLLGEASIILRVDKSSSGMLQIGDTLSGKIASGLMGNISENIVPQLDKMLPRVDSILLCLHVLLSNPALNQSIEQVQQTTANLEHSTRQLAILMNRDIPTITNNLTTVSSDFTQVSSNLKEVDLQSTMNAVDRSVKNLEQMTFKMNDPNSSLGLLMSDRSLYDNLESTTKNADSLMIDLKKNPKRYVHFSIW